MITTFSFSLLGERESKFQYKRAIMAFYWCADDGLTLNASLVALWFQGIRTCIAKKPYIFCDSDQTKFMNFSAL